MDPSKQGKSDTLHHHIGFSSNLFDVKSAFTPGIVHLLVLAIANAFSDYLHQNYIMETFIPLCLERNEQAIVQQASRFVALTTFPLVFIPAVLADSYLSESGSLGVLCYLCR